MTKLDSLKVYTAKLGWNVIPVNENSKLPIGQKWNKVTWSIDDLLSMLTRRPNINIGLLLGDIVDVEADTPGANLMLDRILGDYPHPIYQSTKSKHHLFLTPDKNLTRFTTQHIEFRGLKHHSVLPPSKINGIEYKWLYSGPIPPMPKSLLKFFLKTRHKRKLW